MTVFKIKRTGAPFIGGGNEIDLGCYSASDKCSSRLWKTFIYAACNASRLDFDYKSDFLAPSLVPKTLFKSSTFVDLITYPTTSSSVTTWTFCNIPTNPIKFDKQSVACGELLFYSNEKCYGVKGCHIVVIACLFCSFALASPDKTLIWLVLKCYDYTFFDARRRNRIQGDLEVSLNELCSERNAVDFLMYLTTHRR